MTAALAFEAVRLGFGRRLIIEEVNLAIAPGEIVGLVGANGSGKTTLMRAGVGLVRPLAGEIRLADRPVGRWSERKRAERLAWMPQERAVGWNLPAREVAALGAPFDGPALARDKAVEALARVGLDSLADRGVLELSAGERAKVLFARLLVTAAPVQLADEPTADMDLAGELLALDLLREEAARGAAVLVSLHDLALTARFCDRVAVLAAGRLAALGAPREALAPAVLAEAFGVRAAWLDGVAGPALSASRL